MLDISQPTRQSKKSILFYLFKNIKGLLFAGLYAIFGVSSWSTMGWTAVGIIIFTVIALISPVLRYYFFTFHIHAGELVINDGFLFKQRKAIPIDRIQSINIQQNVLQRLLGISTLELETAGSSGKELEIPALEFAFAKALKDTLNSNHTTLASEPAVVLDDAENADNPENADQNTNLEKANAAVPKEKEAPRTIIKLSVLDLLKIGITQNHLKSGGIALGVVIGLWFKIKDVVAHYLGDPFENIEEDIGTTLATQQFNPADYWWSVIVGVIVFSVVSVIVSVVLAVTKYWDFNMLHDDETIEVRMGLFNRREVKMPLAKVQILEFHSNPLRKLLGYQTARMYQAQSQEAAAGAIEVPACKAHIVKELQQLIFNETLETKILELKPNKWSVMRLSLYIMSAFMIPLLVFSVYFEQVLGIILALFILLITGFVNYKIGKHNALQRDDSFAIFKKGWLFPSVIIMPIFKVQSVGLWRSIFLTNRQEIHATLHTAAGSRSLKYLKEAEARAFTNDIHNEVLQTERRWM